MKQWLMPVRWCCAETSSRVSVCKLEMRSSHSHHARCFQHHFSLFTICTWFEPWRMFSWTARSLAVLKRCYGRTVQMLCHKAIVEMPPSSFHQLTVSFSNHSRCIQIPDEYHLQCRQLALMHRPNLSLRFHSSLNFSTSRNTLIDPHAEQHWFRQWQLHLCLNNGSSSRRIMLLCWEQIILKRWLLVSHCHPSFLCRIVFLHHTKYLSYWLERADYRTTYKFHIPDPTRSIHIQSRWGSTWLAVSAFAERRVLRLVRQPAFQICQMKSRKTSSSMFLEVLGYIETSRQYLKYSEEWWTQELSD